MSRKINVLIADDHSLFAVLVSKLVRTNEDINVVGIACDGKSTLKLAEESHVDVILLDLDMPGMNGIDLMPSLIELKPNMKIIIVSSHTEPWIIQKSIKSGASGYLTKSAGSEELLEAIISVNKGGIYFSRETKDCYMGGLYKTKDQPDNSDSLGRPVTNREKQIIQLIAQEMSTKEIADKLCISSRTVETHRKNILEKLGAKNTVGLIKTAIQYNIIDTSQL